MSSLKPMRKPGVKTVPRGGAGSAGGNARSLGIFLGLLAVVAVVIAAMVIRGRGNGAVGTSAVPVEQAVRPLNAPTGQTAEGYWYKGAADAPVTVEVFGDFQCPACRAAFQQLEGGIDQRYVETGKVRFVFRDFPLSIHPNAVPAAQVARAAGAQGKFWPMHDLLYARQTEWQADRDVLKRFKAYAAELGLDQQAFDRALDTGEFAAPITSAASAARALGVNSTPTYTVDGKQTEAGALTSTIEAALKAKGR